MRIGLWIEGQLGASVPEVGRQLADAAGAGYTRAWVGEVGSWDPLTLLAATGHHGPGLGLGTAIVRTYPRHPLALAAQALTVQATTGARLTLGVGPSHGPVVAGQYGIPFDAPARNTREYLGVLLPLLRGEEVSFRGEHWTAAGRIGVYEVTPPTVLLSALGPAMLRIAGELADGTITAWAGPSTIGSFVQPRLSRAAAAAGRPDPQVVAQVCVCVTSDPDGARRWVDDAFAPAAELPSYRAVFEREGLSSPGAAILAGDETAVERGLRRFADAGATEVQVVPVGSPEEKSRTRVALGAFEL
jgi:F420-dependent oxidoreductase-like protein